MSRFRPLLSQYDLTEQQWRILRALHDGEDHALEISELARRCCILLPSISGILKRLENKNLVSRVTDSSDQRRSLISLTDSAHRLMQEVAPHSEQRYAEIEQAFGHERLQSLYHLLAELELSLQASPPSSLPRDNKHGE